MTEPTNSWLDNFIRRHDLPAAFAGLWKNHYQPLAQTLEARAGACKQQCGQALILGINGCQGSGKSTLAALLCSYVQNQRGWRVANLSIDDFYLGRPERQQLAARLHPLFMTRGVPGTHDMALLNTTLDQLLKGDSAVAIPRFDKASDDRKPVADWDVVQAPVDLILLEGWCMGVSPQTAQQLQQPCNELEAQEDADGRWRGLVNQFLASEYQQLFSRVDCWLMLQAPGFDAVYRWRLEQEQKLAARVGESPAGVMSEAQLQRFIQHYQRLTEQALETMPSIVDYLVELDESRDVRGIICRQ